jgi:uncharacterized cofD-like protein
MQRKKIVTIGGGTGSFTLLSGLKKYPVDISAIVSMADDGGSTGVLRDELGVLPPGDVRQCLVALSESSEKMRTLMNYRFEEGGLRGHSFGNLLLSALEKVNGSFSAGVEEAMHILNVKGEVIPVTEHDAQLELLLDDGTILHGEDEINRHTSFQDIGVRELRFTREEAPVKAYARAIKRVLSADMIVIGPGNVYCSLLPNLIIPDFAEAIRQSSARLVYIANLTNKKGHTSGWDVDAYVEAIERYIGQGRIDSVVYNTKKPRKELVERYSAQEGGELVVWRERPQEERSYRLVRARVISDTLPLLQKDDAVASLRAFIRHDSEKLAQAVMFLLEQESYQKIIQDIV